MPGFTFRGRHYNNPAELSLAVVGGKWKMPILWHVKDRPWRYGELKRSLGRVTHKMLSQQLRELERDGMVEREVKGVVPAHVEYRITDAGQEAIVIIGHLREFGLRFRERHA